MKDKNETLKIIGHELKKNNILNWYVIHSTYLKNDICIFEYRAFIKKNTWIFEILLKFLKWIDRNYVIQKGVGVYHKKNCAANYICDYCYTKFKTEKGRKIHEKRKHNKKINK